MNYKEGFLYKKKEDLTRADIVGRWVWEKTGMLEKHEKIYEAIEDWIEETVPLSDFAIENKVICDNRLRYYEGTMGLNPEILDRNDEEFYLWGMDKKWSEEERIWQNYLGTNG